MRRKSVVVVSIIAAFLIMAVSAQADGELSRATGGGQIVDGQGVGDTIAFTAQASPTDPLTGEGQIQYIDRNFLGTIKRHGVVDCLIVGGNVAIFSGVWTIGPNVGGQFEALVQDEGEGTIDDLIAVNPEALNSGCGNDSFGQLTDLARGNVQVYMGTL
jgi:hypothetical protein